MEVLIQVAQLFLSLSILVVLHEMGHFLPAVWFKTRVEKFYLFFDPWFSVLKKKIGDTEYGLGWLPLGGYVKIAGMVDESMDTEQMKQPPQPWEFRSKPAWQRLIIMLGGVTVNALLAVLIYSMLLYVQGEEFLPVQNAKYGIVADSLGAEIGLRTGDKIIGYDHGKQFDNFNKIIPTLLLDNALSMQVERNGEKVNIAIPQSTYKKLINSKTEGFFTLAFPATIGDFASGSVLKAAGAQVNDRIVLMNEEPVQFFEEVRIKLRGLKGQDTRIGLLRGTDTVFVQVQVPASGLLGFMAADISKEFEYETKRYSFFGSFPAGWHKTGETLTAFIKQFKVIFNPEMEGYKHVGGFIAIGKMFRPAWDWVHFWTMTAFLSIMLAFMNLLPIPALDGGHVMFTLFEMLTGRKPSEKFLERAQLVGMVLLLSLLLYANGNDLFKWISDKFL